MVLFTSLFRFKLCIKCTSDAHDHDDQTISDRIRTRRACVPRNLDASRVVCRCVQCRLSLNPLSSVVVSNVVCRCIQCHLSLYPMSSVAVSHVVCRCIPCRLVRKGYSLIVALLCFILSTIYALKPRPRLIHHRHVSTIFGRLQRQRRFR